MSDEDFHEGGCRCGAVRFRVRGRPLITMACHCTGCQRMTSSAFSLSSLYGQENFELLQGEPELGGIRGEVRHHCCPDCKSWMYTQFDAMGPFVNVRPTMLDDCQDYKPFLESYTSEKLPWAATPAVHSFDKFPPAEMFPELLSAYAQSDF